MIRGDRLFIHIGNNNAIRSKEIIGIVNIDVIASSSIMEEMIANQKAKKKVYGPLSNAKSVIIMAEKIYFSSLSVITLKKRSGMTAMIEKY